MPARLGDGWQQWVSGNRGSRRVHISNFSFHSFPGNSRTHLGIEVYGNGFWVMKTLNHVQLGCWFKGEVYSLCVLYPSPGTQPVVLNVLRHICTLLVPTPNRTNWSAFLKQTIIFYHGAKCADGFGAAYAAWLRFGEGAQYVPCVYGDVPPDVTNKDVYVLDFCFDLEKTTVMAAQAHSFTVLDHHVTAQSKLRGFKPACCGKIHFDLGRCGAALAWDHFRPGTPLPELIRYIQARDLWTWDEPDAEAVLTWLDVQPQTFEAWHRFAQYEDEDFEAILVQGKAMLQKHRALADSIGANASPVVVNGRAGLAVNCSQEFRDEVGNSLAQRCGSFGLVWSMEPGGRIKVSLRSVKAVDVESLARSFGGGGHEHAASFYLPATPVAFAMLATGALTSLPS